MIYSADVWIEATHRDVCSEPVRALIRLLKFKLVLWLLENIALAMAIVIETTQREVCSASAGTQYNGLLLILFRAQYFEHNTMGY